MKIASITAPNPGPFTLDGTRTWLLGDKAIIDPGPAIDSHLDAIVAAMPGLVLIFITHRHGDHAPGAAVLKRRTRANVIAPAGVLDDDTVDVRVRGGEVFTIDGETLEAIATPGHTGEHICYLTSGGDLFSGDTILGSGTTAIFPPDGDMAAYLDSLRRLRARAPKVIRPAHGPDRYDAVALIDHYIAHRLERERQIASAIAGGAGDLSAIRLQVYPDLHEGLHRGAEAQIVAHLTKLEADGAITSEGGYRLKTQS